MSFTDENGTNNFSHLPVQTGENMMHLTIALDDILHAFPETADYLPVVSPHAEKFNSS